MTNLEFKDKELVIIREALEVSIDNHRAFLGSDTNGVLFEDLMQFADTVYVLNKVQDASVEIEV